MILTPAQLAERWHVSDDTILTMFRRGKLPAFQVGRQWRIALEDVEAFERGKRWHHESESPRRAGGAATDRSGTSERDGASPGVPLSLAEANTLRLNRRRMRGDGGNSTE